MSVGSYTTLYLHPLTGLAHAWEAKAALSAAVVAAAALAESLFATRFDFLALVGVLVLVDLLTGFVRAWRTGERIESRKMRQTVIKVLEYTALLIVAVGIGNVFGVRGGLPVISGVLAHTGEMAFVYVALTEFRSIGENLAPGGGPRRALEAVVEWFRRKVEAGA